MLTPVTILGPERVTDIQQADMLVRCRDDDYHVDRSILCHHSQWFGKVYSKVNYPKMSRRIVDLSADDPGAVAAMIQFCYQLDYGDTRSDSNSALYSVVTLRPHIDTYLLAERYGMPGLQKLSAQKFEKLAIAVLTAVSDEEEFLQAVKDLQAFQRMNQPRHRDQHAQPSKRVLSYPLGATSLRHQGLNQENETPLDLVSAAVFAEVSNTRIRHPAPVGLQYADPALYDYASLQYALSRNDPGPEVEYELGSSPPPLFHDRQPKFSARHDSLPTPPIVRGRPMFSPSPYVRPDLNPSLSDIINSHVQPGIGLSPMSDASTAVGPLTPSALNFGDLTLNGQGYLIPSSPLRHVNQGGRATVRAVPISSFAKHFPELNHNDVVIMFDKGKSLVKADKYPMCTASRLFAQLLDGPFLDHGLTRCIRLRNDFPYAITTMFHFIETGNYVFDQRAFAAYPLLTALDFHIHTYLAGSKYGFVAFLERAINAYVAVAEHELRLCFLATSSDQLSDMRIPMPGFPVMPSSDAQTDSEATVTPIDRFLNSLVLLWRNTQSRLDALRKAVLELIKRYSGKLLRTPFFVTLLQEVVGFGDDILASLGEDGFEVKAFQVPPGARVNQTVRFDT
ncbi:hypothetical protein E8E12_005097 [Didymella heteroderae]|uniref:BTB domain-containing protein n=1 Tax=Didymella heteroderae TaxID=1769908 RepID=A0A9P4WIT8_9PLEO|nr:hypothetical protein E8E12_005097 [Didymella heteroderae]